MPKSALLFVVGLCLVAAEPLFAQDRDTKVRNDRAAFNGSADWIYNDLGEGIRAAKAADKPLFVVLRCIPCEACQEFDDDVARRDPIIRDLLDQYVCVRIVQANTLDLTHFQDDFDQSFAVFLVNPDLTVYGRQEMWEDSPHGWLQRSKGKQNFRTGERPIAQWSRLKAGYSDDLGTGSG